MNTSLPEPQPPAKDDPRIIAGWCMYDWANSAYITTVSVGLLPAYFARVIVPPGGALISGVHYSATTLWGMTVGCAALLTFLLAPVLGSIADLSGSKKRFLLCFAYLGSAATLLLALSGSGDVLSTLVLFLVAQVGFTAGNIFYDAFLPQIASPQKMDWASGKGYAYGYLGGGLQFALALGLVSGHEFFGISQSAAVRIGIAMAGIWWGGFALFTAKWLQEGTSPGVNPATGTRPSAAAYVVLGIVRTWRTLRRIARFRHLVLFLISFMLYNDGIQTVIDMATIYGTEELGLSNQVLMVTLLMIQAVASLGALAFSRLADAFGSKRTIMITLLLWSAVVIGAYFIRTSTQYFMLGVGVGCILGGSQALSRSFYSLMVPERASAEFFGFYTVFTKFSAFWGPFFFAFVRHWTGSARLSILSLVIFFIGGLVLLALVDERKAALARMSEVF